jgi:hypothetical protein
MERFYNKNMRRAKTKSANTEIKNIREGHKHEAHVRPYINTIRMPIPTHTSCFYTCSNVYSSITIMVAYYFDHEVLYYTVRALVLVHP